MIEGGGSAVSNGWKNMFEDMMFPFLSCATGPAGLTRLSHFNEYFSSFFCEQSVSLVGPVARFFVYIYMYI